MGRRCGSRNETACNNNNNNDNNDNTPAGGDAGCVLSACSVLRHLALVGARGRRPLLKAGERRPHLECPSSRITSRQEHMPKKQNCPFLSMYGVAIPETISVYESIPPDRGAGAPGRPCVAVAPCESRTFNPLPHYASPGGASNPRMAHAETGKRNCRASTSHLLAEENEKGEEKREEFRQPCGRPRVKLPSYEAAASLCHPALNGGGCKPTWASCMRHYAHAPPPLHRPSRRRAPKKKKVPSGGARGALIISRACIRHR